MNPVRDCDGHVVWRVRVVPGEQTCLDCGETTTDAYCWRCAGEQDLDFRAAIQQARLTPTTGYLRPEEIER